MKYIKVSDEDVIMFKVGLDLYEKAFPIYERRLLSDQIKALYDPSYYFITAFDDSGKFVGIMLYWTTESFVYIEHFAIDEKLRGQNYGSKVLADFCKNYAKLPIILEIEPVQDEKTESRKRFYEKQDFSQLDVKHMQVKFHDKCPELELKILAKPKISLELYDEFRRFLDTTVAKYTS